MWRLLTLMQKNLVWTIPAMMIMGVIGGHFFDLSGLKVLVMPLTFLMVYPMMVNIQLEKIFSLTDMKCQLVTQLINFAVIPFIAFGLGSYFFADAPMLILGLLFAALLPTSGMTISWTGFAKGNIDAAIKMTVVGLILGSLATPFYAKWLMGEVIDVPIKTILLSILMVVFLPMLFGYLTKRFLLARYGKEMYQRRLKHKFPLLSTLGVLGIVFVAMALKARNITDNPLVLLEYLMPLLLLYVLNLIISTVIGKLFFERGEAIALVYGTVLRNLSIALAIAMTVFAEKGSEIAIIIALAYIVQAQMAAWYARWVDKIFGLPEADVEV